MVIDAHHHLWQYSAAEYDWIDESMAAIRRDFLPADLQTTLALGGVAGAVTVQARQSLRETEWLLQLAEACAQMLGVVGWVPLRDPGVETLLRTLLAAPGGRALKGVRHVIQGDADPTFMAGEGFNRGIAAVTRCGLTYDLLIKAPQLPEALALVRRHPAQVFVLDHIAKPVVQGPPPRAWVEAMRALAAEPQVSVKFSGVVTEVPGWQWSVDLLRPYFAVVWEAFGPNRVLFASDWPVCLVAAGYRDWVEAVQQLTAELPAAEAAAFWGENAVRLYRL